MGRIFRTDLVSPRLHLIRLFIRHHRVIDSVCPLESEAWFEISQFKCYSSHLAPQSTVSILEQHFISCSFKQMHRFCRSFEATYFRFSLESCFYCLWILSFANYLPGDHWYFLLWVIITSTFLSLFQLFSPGLRKTFINPQQIVVL